MSITSRQLLERSDLRSVSYHNLRFVIFCVVVAFVNNLICFFYEKIKSFRLQVVDNCIESV